MAGHKARSGSAATNAKGKNSFISKIKGVLSSTSKSQENENKGPVPSPTNPVPATRHDSVTKAGTLQVLPPSTSLSTTPSSSATAPAGASGTPSEVISSPSILTTAPSSTGNHSNTLVKVSDTDSQPLHPISELWNEAYEDLRVNEKGLIKDYEEILSRDLSTFVGSTIILSPAKTIRKDQMKVVLDKKVVYVDAHKWKLRFNNNDKGFPVEDLVKLVVTILGWANNYIAPVLALNLYASIAWAGVALILPVSLRFEQYQSSSICLIEIDISLNLSNEG
jgi:hypothetical protein